MSVEDPAESIDLTLIYGVLHIINFAHGAALMVALYGVFFLKDKLGIDPYWALPIMVPAMFVLGYALQRGVINRASHGKDENILLVTLGISIVLENRQFLLDLQPEARQKLLVSCSPQFAVKSVAWEDNDTIITVAGDCSPVGAGDKIIYVRAE